MLASPRVPTVRSVSATTRTAALTGGARVDVCLVDGVLANLIAAYLLAREKRIVMVVDEGARTGISAHEAVQLSSMIEQPFFELVAEHGEDSARLATQSYVAAIDALETIVRRERIACEFERLDGYRFSGAGASRAEAELEVEAAHRAGAHDVELVACAPIEGADSGPCVRYPRQVQFHPGKLAEGLAKAIAREGGRIHCGVSVRAIEPGRPSNLVTTAGHRIDSEYIVTPGKEPGRAAQVIGLRMPRGAVSRALYWSTGESVRCARLRNGGTSGEMLLVAGDDTPAALEAWARNHFPRVGEVAQRFAAQMPDASDLFALAGFEDGGSKSLYVSTASWGSAVTRAVVAGMSIRDFIVGARYPEALQPPLPRDFS